MERGPKTGVIVAGGAVSMGAATCLALAEQGRPVAVWDIQEAPARAVAAECHERFGVATDVQVVDLGDEAAMAAAVARTRSALGGIGGLAYVAGVNAWEEGLDKVGGPGWERVMEVNLRGPARLIRLLHASLKEANPGSAVVLTSSASIIDLGAWRDAAYISAKTGLLGLMRSISRALAGDGIRVNMICPGTTDSALFRHGLANIGRPLDDIVSQIPLRRLGQPEDIANAIRFLLSDEASFITGVNLMVDGGRTVGGGKR
jgi:NAD(P)-dependent dehydrogenase (short-subunit alcohol dehydrogenase family)